MAYIYRHIRLDKDEVFYVGIGSDLEFYRAYKKTQRTKYWNHIAAKGYIVEIMIDNLTWEQACQKEKEFIKLYGRKDLEFGTLVNMTDGGEGNQNLSLESKKSKGEKISAKKLGVPNLKLRKPKTEDHKIKLRLANLGKKYSKEVNMKKANNNQYGENNHMFGKYYVTDGLNTMILKKNEEIPTGYYKGRTIIKNTNRNKI